MNEHITFGLFALYVAVVSLVLVLAGRQDNLLALLRRFWGRAMGHALYFVGRVALPLLVCAICLGWGVRHYDASTGISFQSNPLHLNVQYYRQLLITMDKHRVPDPLEVLYGA